MSFSLQFLALALGVANAAILLVKPIPRLHSRLDMVEYRLAQLEADVDRLRKDG